MNICFNERPPPFSFIASTNFQL